MSPQKTSKEFGFKELRVWQKAVEFADNAISLAESLNTSSNHKMVDQFKVASASISMSIAGGKGQYSDKEFIRCLNIALESLYETVILSEIFHIRDWISEEQKDQFHKEAFTIAAMLKGLISKI